MHTALISLFETNLSGAIFQTIVHSLWQIPVIALSLKLLNQRPSLRSSIGNYNTNLFVIIMSLVMAIFTFVFFLMQQEEVAGVTSGTISSSLPISAVFANEWINGVGNTSGSWNRWLAPYQMYIVIAWALGVCFFISRIFAGWIGLHYIKRSLTFDTSPELKASFNRIKKTLGIRQSIRLGHSTLSTIPMVIGHLRPIVLLPVATINQLTTEEVEAIMVHELAHILQYDFLKNLIVMLGEALFFYHPVIWLLSAEIKEEREHCCDDTVMKYFPNRMRYAKMLVKLEELQMGQSTKLSMALFNTKFKLMKRVKRILNSQYEPRLRKSNILFAALLLCSLVVFSSANLLSPDVEELDPVIENSLIPSFTENIDLNEIIDDLETEAVFDDIFIKEVLEEIQSVQFKSAPLTSLADPSSFVFPARDTLDKEEREKLKKKMKEKRKELREKTKEIRDKMKAQREKIRAEYKDELKLKSKELKEIRKKLEKDGNSFNFQHDGDFEFEFDSDKLGEWAEKMGEWGAELGEKVAAQFDEDWVEDMAEMGAEIGESFGESFGDMFDEEWAAKWERYGEKFEEDMEGIFNEEWAENMASIGEEIAASFDEEWLEDITDMSEEISQAVAEAMEELDEEDFNYNYTYGDVKDSKALKSNMVAKLNRDGLLGDGKNTIVITDEKMTVNGVSQSNSLLKSYQDIIRSNSDEAFRGDATKVKFILEGTSLENSDRTILSVQVDN